MSSAVLPVLAAYLGGALMSAEGVVLIPAGTFTMGNSLHATGDGYSSELPLHQVTLPAFFLATTETTFTECKLMGSMFDRCTFDLMLVSGYLMATGHFGGHGA